MIPRMILGTGLVARVYEFDIACGYCPLPHHIAICEAHARYVAKTEPVYSLAAHGAACQVCIVCEEALRLLAPRRDILEKVLGDIDGLMTKALGFKFKGAGYATRTRP
jgi:hypothetical protein